MSSIGKIREQYEENRTESDFANDLVSRKKNWHKDIFTVATLLITVFVLFIDKLWKPHDGFLLDDMFYFKLIIAVSVLVIAGLVILLNKRTDNKTIKELAKHNIPVIEVLKVFEELEKMLENNVPRIETASKNLRTAPVSNLITWEDSHNIEVEAKKVWAFSYSLKWLTQNEHRRVHEILEELKNDNEHEYHFILAKSDSVETETIQTTIQTFITDFDRNNNTQTKDRFIIKIISKPKLLFPIPNDIVICQNFIEGGEEKNIVVITSTELTDKTGNIEFDKTFDIAFREPIQITRVVKWYEDIWKKAKTL